MGQFGFVGRRVGFWGLRVVLGHRELCLGIWGWWLGLGGHILVFGRAGFGLASDWVWWVLTCDFGVGEG